METRKNARPQRQGVPDTERSCVFLTWNCIGYIIEVVDVLYEAIPFFNPQKRMKYTYSSSERR